MKPTNMQAWFVVRTGEPLASMQLMETPRPLPADGELLVRVHACGINFADALMCRGLYQRRPELPYTPGFEACGIVAQTAPGCEAWLGVRVAGPTLSRAGGLAEYCLIRADDAHRVAEAMTDAQAAMLAATYETAWVALFNRAAAGAGDTVLVNAGAGALGSAAIQLACAAGLRVIATAGGAEKTAQCLRQGATLAIDYRQEDFVVAVKSATGGRGVDIVIESVGGEVFEKSLRVIADGGRIVVIGFSSGTIPSIPANRLLLKNCTVSGMQTDWFREHLPSVMRECRTRLRELFERGAISPWVGAEYEFEQAPAAIAAMESRANMGKIVVRTTSTT